MANLREFQVLKIENHDFMNNLALKIMHFEIFDINYIDEKDTKYSNLLKK